MNLPDHLNPIVTRCAAILEASGRPDAEQRERMAVVLEALTWIGTPYHSHGTLKGVGVDCAHMPIKVFAFAGIIQDFDPGYYPQDWHLHNSEELYLNNIERHAHRTDRTLLNALPGDVPLFQFGRTVSHSAIMLDAPQVIHAYMGLGVVLEDATNGNLVSAPEHVPQRYVGVWSFWGDK